MVSIQSIILHNLSSIDISSLFFRNSLTRGSSPVLVCASSVVLFTSTPILDLGKYCCTFVVIFPVPKSPKSLRSSRKFFVFLSH